MIPHMVAHGSGNQQLENQYLQRINASFFRLNDIQTMALEVSGRPLDVTSPQNWITALDVYLQLPRVVITEKKFRFAIQLLWLREYLSGVHVISQGISNGPQMQRNPIMERRFEEHISLLEFHIEQWASYFAGWSIPQVASIPEHVPFLWGPENFGTPWLLDSSAWMTLPYINLMGAVFETKPQIWIFKHGNDTIVMSHWALWAIYRHRAQFWPTPDSKQKKVLQKMCAMLAYLIKSAKAQQHIPSLTSPKDVSALTLDWNNFAQFQNLYITSLDLPDENDVLETVSEPGLLVIAGSGLIKAEHWRKLCLCLALNYPVIMLPLPPVQLFQIFRGLFRFYGDHIPASNRNEADTQLIECILRHLVVRFEFLTGSARISEVSVSGKTYYRCLVDWTKSRFSFFPPILQNCNSDQAHELNESRIADIQRILLARVTTVSPNAELRCVGHFRFGDIFFPPVKYVECADMFLAMKMLYLQNCGKAFDVEEVTMAKCRSVIKLLRCEPHSDFETVLGQTLRDATSNGWMIQNFDAAVKIFAEICGSVCFCTGEKLVLNLADGRTLIFENGSCLKHTENGYVFDQNLMLSWQHLWGEYRANGLVTEIFPQTANVRYDTVNSLLSSEEMKALRRCIVILIYQSKTPIINLAGDRIFFGLACSDGLRYVLPGLYMPPDAEILSRSITNTLAMGADRQLDVGTFVVNTVEALASLLAQSERVPELDAFAINEISAGILQEGWTQGEIFAYLQGYFDAQAVPE
ncbi:MAG: hypothetical protein LBI34_04155 [Puniceicoccales bacterium]|jgi:hypothetical protein|nr:hypothetical protein [Puniceicoccales bacterium]